MRAAMEAEVVWTADETAMADNARNEHNVCCPECNKVYADAEIPWVTEFYYGAKVEVPGDCDNPECPAADYGKAQLQFFDWETGEECGFASVDEHAAERRQMGLVNF